MAECEPKELFISYGREEKVTQFVCRLKSDLEQNGFTVWLDLQVSGKTPCRGILHCCLLGTFHRIYHLAVIGMEP